MAENSPTINPKDYEVNLREPKIGSESRLYEGLNKNRKQIAFKIYPDRPNIPHVSLSRLTFYQDLTNEIADTHNGRGETIQITINGKTQYLNLYIVPIDSVGITALPDEPNTNCPCAISELIQGPTLLDLEPNYISSRHNSLKDDPLVQLGAKFRQETGIDTISIIPWNVKIILDKEPPMLAITDITGSIADLKIPEGVS